MDSSQIQGSQAPRLGFLDMVAASPVLGALAALAQYFQTKMILPQAGPIKRRMAP